MPPTSFYVAAGRRFASTELTRGPWDPSSQHAGPPCALLGSELERVGELEGARVARASFDILRPIPITTLTATARVTRPGRSVELVEGALLDGDTELVRARAWRIRTAAVPEHTRPSIPAPTPPHSGVEQPFFDTGHELGYHTAMEARFLAGSYREPGPARAWLRMRVDLVEGQRPTPLERVLVAADSGNGVSGPLDYRRFLFINTDLSVALRRPLIGEWVCLDATTSTEPDGIGLTEATLLDGEGQLGHASQSLLVAAR